MCIADVKTFKKKLARLSERIRSDDCSGQFYWVDSVLVKALREGHWLLISNANFCRYTCTHIHTHTRTQARTHMHQIYVYRSCEVVLYFVCIQFCYLCSASVLDRLNAVLEPGGVLTLDEKGADGDSIPSIKAHPSFRYAR